jgi:putative protease
MAKSIEILAPAGDRNGVIAAINGGADAVYFGGLHFNARQKAHNFDDDALADIVKLCRRHGVKAYVTLNTLIKDDELDEALTYAAFLNKLAPEGVIVQDPGLFWTLRRLFPGLALQTSTQASVYGLEGVRFFEELGFTRVVLPREMGLDEVAMIRQHTGIELKVFGHGALCYAYSGQCLFSSLVGGRSGNRGLCAQPCRKHYTLTDDRGEVVNSGTLMSMKDLNTLAELPKLAEAGVDAVKIEGRMKSPAYIYSTSRAYSKAKNGEAPEDLEADQRELAQVFNRRFTSGWLLGSRDNINPETGKNRGIRAGTVTAAGRGEITVALLPRITLEQGDGIAFGEDARQGMGITRLKKQHGSVRIALSADCGVRKGQAVYKTYDAVLMGELTRKAEAKPQENRRDLDLALTLKEGEPVVVTARSGGAVKSITTDLCPQRAQNRGLTVETVKRQLEKMGDTPYRLGTLDADIQGDLFLSKSELNAIRRAVIEEMAGRTAQASSCGEAPRADQLLKDLAVKRQPPDRPVLSLELSDGCDWKAYLNADVDEIVVPLEDFKDEDALCAAFEAIRAAGKKAVAALPRIMNSACSAAVVKGLPAICRQRPDGFLARNYEALHLLRGRDIPVEADISLHCFNRLSTQALKDWGCASVILSPELTGSEAEIIARGSAIPCGLQVYGRQEMMVSANCLRNCDHKHCADCPDHRLYQLTDQRGAGFPLRRDALGYTRIYNSDKLFLKGELLRVRHLAKWRILVLDETPEEIAAAAAYYRSGCRSGEEEIARWFSGRATKGNFKRGVE